MNTGITRFFSKYVFKMCITKWKKYNLGTQMASIGRIKKITWSMKCLKQEEKQYKTKTVWGNEWFWNIL